MIRVFDPPSHWEEVPFWSLFTRVKRTGFANEELLSVYRDHGVIPKSSRDDNHNVASEDLSSYQLVEPGDLVVNKMKAWQGSFAISDYRGIVSPAYFVFKPHHASDSRFLHYLLRSSPYMAHYNRISSGVRIGQWDLDPGQLRITQVGLPPLEEQRAIANYLDHEADTFDAILRAQSALKSKLLERRQSLIANRLKSDAYASDGLPSEPSTLPADWTRARLKTFAKICNGRDYKDIELNEGGYPVFGSGGEFARAAQKMYCGESVLFGRKGTVNKPLYVNVCFWTVDTMYYTELNGKVDTKYVYYWATTLPYEAYSTNTALPSMTASVIKNFVMASPSKAEQTRIVSELDADVKAIDNLINKTDSLEKILSIRYASLVAAAVTGKIDVKELSRG